MSSRFAPEICISRLVASPAKGGKRESGLRRGEAVVDHVSRKMKKETSFQIHGK